MSTKEILLDILQNYVDVPLDQVDTDKAFRTAAGLDSFVFIAMVGDIEDRFGINIPNQDMRGFTTLDDIIAYIDERLKNKQ